MEKLTFQALNALFTQFNQLESTVLWIRNKNNQKQLYVSEAFEDIWGRSSHLLYNNPATWNDFLAPAEKQAVLNKISARFNTPEIITDNTVTFQIVDQLGNLKHIKDTAYLLTDDNGEHVGFIGLGQLISEQEWQAELARKSLDKKDSNDQLKKYLFEILQNELQLNTTSTQSIETQLKNQSSHEQCFVIHQGQQLMLTNREAECLLHLAAGLSAKQTAAILNISTRTVEFHLNNIKTKANCRTKIELLSKTVLK